MSIKQVVEKIYHNYEARNLPEVLAVIPDDFCFEWPCDENHAKFSGVCRSKNEFLGQLMAMAEKFEFNGYSAATVIVEGNQAAAQVSLNVTSKCTGDTFSSTVAHFWTFDGEKPVKLVEYMDTALVAHQCG